MKRNVAIILATVASAMGSQFPSPVSAEKSILQEVEATPGKALLPPRVDHLGVRATLLRWGMSAGDVERIMGAPAPADSFVREDDGLRVLKYGRLGYRRDD
jgi:hypothetical protein